MLIVPAFFSLQRLYESAYRDLTIVIRELLVKPAKPRERRMELVR